MLSINLNVCFLQSDALIIGEIHINKKDTNESRLLGDTM